MDDMTMFLRQHCIVTMFHIWVGLISADPGNGKVEAGLVAGGQSAHSVPKSTNILQQCSADLTSSCTNTNIYADYNVISTFQLKSQIWAGGYNLAEFLAAGKSISNL